VNVKPAERVSFVTVPEDLGPWVFHCHVLYHMEMGMFRVFDVVPPAGATPVATQAAR
jgi:FtsP/CotA-like multicopper oxidase with cupredoxin domain